MSYLGGKLLFKALEQAEVAKVVCAHVLLKAMLSVAQRNPHHAGIQNEHINASFLMQLLSKGSDRVEVPQVHLSCNHLPLHVTSTV